MGQGKVLMILLGMVVFFGVALHFFTLIIAPPPTQHQVDTSFDVSRPRAPSEARKLTNPMLLSPKMVEEGDALYHGKGGCYACHGDTGKGDGEAGELLISPPPRDLTDPAFQMLRTDGEIFWSIKNGVDRTGMFANVPRIISEEEAWKIVHYVRSIGQQD